MIYCEVCGETGDSQPVMVVMEDDLGEFRVCGPDYRKGHDSRPVPPEYRIDFSPKERATLKHAAGMITARTKKIKNHHRYGISQEELDLNGLTAEWAVARSLGLKFAECGMFKKGQELDGGVDLTTHDGITIQVKGTRPTDNPSHPRTVLALESNQLLEDVRDRKGHLLVLVCLHESRRYALIRGYITGSDFRRVAKKHRRGQGLELLGVEAHALLPWKRVAS